MRLWKVLGETRSKLKALPRALFHAARKVFTTATDSGSSAHSTVMLGISSKSSCRSREGMPWAASVS